MSIRKRIVSIIFLLGIFSAPLYSRTENLKLVIIPITTLAAGKISDNTLLARVYISGVSKACNVNVWDDMAENETIPGYYTLRNEKSGKGFIKVKLKGAQWQPSTLSGKGVHMRTSGKNSALELMSNGEQFVPVSSVHAQLTAQCIAINPNQKEVHQMVK